MAAEISLLALVLKLTLPLAAAPDTTLKSSDTEVSFTFDDLAHLVAHCGGVVSGVR